MIRAFPTLFQNRSQALHHLFCVIGNGYDWEHGELISIYSEELYAQHEQDPILLPEPFNARYEISNQWELARLMSVRQNASTLARVNGPGISLYPYTDSAHIVNLPSDITEDWALAAVEHAWEIDGLWPTQTHAFREQWVEKLTEKGILDAW